MSQVSMKLLLWILGLTGAMTTMHAQQDRNLTGYTLVFSDEFNGGPEVSVAVHPYDKGNKTWFYWPPYGPAGAFSFSEWSADERSMRIENGVLLNTAWWDPELEGPWGSQWRSGCLASMDKERDGFAQRFGYWSARMKMPNAEQGAWPAFWLASASGIPNASTKGYEIDILEWYGAQADPDIYGGTVHPWNEDGSQAPEPYQGGQWVTVGDMVNQWHIYGCQVDPEWITFYLDGQEVYRRPTHAEYIIEPLYIILNYALREPLSGNPFTSHGDSTLQVDWVRAYSLPDTAPSVLPPTNLRIIP
jgi:beta-glucanase (GH16 family)